MRSCLCRVETSRASISWGLKWFYIVALRRGSIEDGSSRLETGLEIHGMYETNRNCPEYSVGVTGLRYRIALLVLMRLDIKFPVIALLATYALKIYQ